MSPTLQNCVEPQIRRISSWTRWASGIKLMSTRHGGSMSATMATSKDSQSKRLSTNSVKSRSNSGDNHLMILHLWLISIIRTTLDLMSFIKAYQKRITRRCPLERVSRWWESVSKITGRTRSFQLSKTWVASRYYSPLISTFWEPWSYTWLTWILIRFQNWLFLMRHHLSLNLINLRIIS